MANVGLLTFHFSNNFGALLQAYALRRWLLEAGHEAAFINYRPAHIEEVGAIRWGIDRQTLKANARSIYQYLSEFRRTLYGHGRQVERFDGFRKDVLNVRGPQVRNLYDLGASASNFEVLIAGSDQIWAPTSNGDFDPAYFLSFAQGGTRAISYAASFGRDDLEQRYFGELQKLLSGLSAISVRERSAVGIVQVASHITAECVPDPTLLHTDYKSLLEQSTNQRTGHVFCYALRSAEGIRSAAVSAASALHVPVVSPFNPHRRWREIGETVYPGPIEWLDQIAKAEFVVTNSFHGVAFSVLMKKPFISVGLPGSRAAFNARSRNLLSELGLMNRFLPHDECSDLNVRKLIDQPIEWDAVDEKLRGLREAGHAFLARQLGSARQSPQRCPVGSPMCAESREA